MLKDAEPPGGRGMCPGGRRDLSRVGPWIAVMVSTLKRSKCCVNYSWWVPWRRGKCSMAEYSRARDATLRKSRLTCPQKDDLEQTRKTSNMQVSICRGERTMRRKERTGRAWERHCEESLILGGHAECWSMSLNQRPEKCLTETTAGTSTANAAFTSPQNHLPCSGSVLPAVTTQHLWNLKRSPESAVTWCPHSLEPVPRLQHRAVWVTWHPACPRRMCLLLIFQVSAHYPVNLGSGGDTTTRVVLGTWQGPCTYPVGGLDAPWQ